MAEQKIAPRRLPKDFNYTKQCWACYGVTMAPDKRGYKCRKCGTTWSKQPSSLPAALVPGGEGAIERRRLGY